MRKFLIALTLILGLLIAGVAVFIAPFDANRYKPLIESELEKRTGYAVRLGKISLGWNGAPAVELQDLSVESFFLAERVSLSLRPLPLFKKKIELLSLVITRPRADLVRQGDGSWNFNRPASKSAPATAPSESSDESSASLPFELDLFQIRDGQARIVDRSGATPLEFSFDDVDADFSNVAFDRPIPFKLKAAVLGTEQNFSAKGKLLLPAGNETPEISELRLEADFNQIDFESLAKIAPALHSLRPVLARGFLTLDAPSLALDADRWARSRAELHLKTRVGEGSLNASASVDGQATVPQISFEADGENLPVEELVPAEPGKPRLKAKASLSVRGNGQGTAWPELSRTLSGEGRLALKEGVLLDLNLLRETFKNLNFIPGAAESLQQNLPPEYAARLHEPHTLLSSVDLPFTFTNGAAQFPQIAVSTPDLALSGSAVATWQGWVDAACLVQMHPVLSQVLYNRVGELKYLLNANGSLQIRLRAQGHLPNVKVIPDPQFLTALLSAKGPELIADLLTRRKGGGDGAAGDQGGESIDKLLKNLF